MESKDKSLTKAQTIEKHKLITLPVVAILMLASVLRIWGLGFGLPYEYHVDEVQYVRQAAEMGASGLEPSWWNNPPLYKYVLLVEYGVLYLFGKSVGWYGSPADFGSKLDLDPTSLYLLGRGTSAILGVMTVLIVYWIGSKSYNRHVGLSSAFFLAVSFLLVRESHFAVNDTFAAFWMMLVLLASIMILKTGEMRWYVLGGISLGLGFATKYSALAAIVPLTLAHFFSTTERWRMPAFLKLGGAYGTTILAAVLGSPYFVLTPSRVWHDAYEALFLGGKYGFEGWQIDPSGGYVFYLKTLIWGLGWGLAILCLLGLLVALLRHEAIDIVLISLPIFTYIFMGKQKMYFARFLIPLMPPIIIMGSSLLQKTILSFLTTDLSRKIGLILAALILAAQSVIADSRFDWLMNQVDTRTIAKSWVEQNIPQGSRIAMDWPFHGIPLSTDEAPIASSTRSYQVMTVGGKGLSDHSVEWYRDKGIDYLVASSFIYRIPLLDNDQNIKRQAFYQSLEDEFVPVQEIKPYEGESEPKFIFDEIYGPAVSLWQRERPGPTLKIYRLSNGE